MNKYNFFFKYHQYRPKMPSFFPNHEHVIKNIIYKDQSVTQILRHTYVKTIFKMFLQKSVERNVQETETLRKCFTFRSHLLLKVSNKGVLCITYFNLMGKLIFMQIIIIKKK